MKYELRDKRQFSGSELCRKLNDGLYQFPFVIYRESALNGSNISMANFGFENPCSLYIKNGEGTVQLRAVNTTGKSALSGEEMIGRVQHMRYFDCGSFVKAESHGNLFTFPASALNFMNIGSNTGQILHGSVSLQVEVNCGPAHMPKSVAIFTIMI